MERPCVLILGSVSAAVTHVVEDSFFVKGFVQNHLGIDCAEFFSALQKDADWTDPSDPALKYRGRELARQKAFYVKDDHSDEVMLLDEEPEVMPIYRYPGFQYGSMRHYRGFNALPKLQTLIQELHRRMTFNDQPVDPNHAILTNYRGADDNIGYHSDKIRDITPNTPIISLSFGETREMHLGLPDPKDPKMKTTTTHRVVLEPGDLFILGSKTNVKYRHAIVPVAEEKTIKRQPGVEVGPRISIVFRDIKSRITRDEARKKAKVTEKRRALKPASSKVGKPNSPKKGRGRKQ